MPAAVPCPPNNELEQFLLGRLEDEDSQSLEGHLASCTVCQQQLTTLAAEDDFVQALRIHSRQMSSGDTAASLQDAPSELVELLVPHFKRIASSYEETATFTSSTVHPNAPTRHGGPTLPGQPTSAPAVPQSIGRYEIRGELGHGGMGTVLHAFDPLLKRSIAIKVIQAKLLDDGMMARLVREAQAAAAVEHDNIVPIFAVEMHTIDKQQGAPCIIMPLLRGSTLKQRLEETDGPLPLAEILRIGREAASGLAAAHEGGLTHCDIKPANLWLEAPADRVKVLDFGLAIARDDKASESESISGTPGYLSPEQARGFVLDGRTDVFSLGCVLYRMATGQAPFTGDRRARALWTVLSDPPTPAAEVNPRVPAELSNLIDRMLARDPAQRPATMQEVVGSLAALERRLVEQQNRFVRRRWLAAVFVVALLSGSGVALWGTLTSPLPAAPVTMTFMGDEPALEVVLGRDGSEQRLTLGREKSIELAPGDYTIRPATEQTLRKLVPDRFTVVAEKPQTLRIAIVGEISQHAMHTRAVTSVAVLPGSSNLVYSASLDRTLVAWEPASTALPRFVNLPHEARAAAVSPSGLDVATAGGNKQPPAELAIRIWDAAKLVSRREPLEGHTRMIMALAWSPDGMQLASAAADDGVLLWNTRTGESEALVPLAPQMLTALAYSANGQQLITGSEEGLVVIWDLRTRKELRTHRASDAPVRTVSFLGDRAVAAGDDGIIRVWKGEQLEHEWLGVQEPVLALAASPDGKQVLSGDAEGTIRVWSVATGRTIHVLRGHKATVQSIALTSNGRQAVSGGADGVVRLWQLPFSD